MLIKIKNLIKIQPKSQPPQKQRKTSILSKNRFLYHFKAY